MKQIFMMLMVIGASFFKPVQAADNVTSPAAMFAFQTSFSTATNIQWEQVGVLSKATFQLKGDYHSAFYNSDGELIAVTQHLPSTKLPKSLQASLKKELANRWISELFVVTIAGDNTYYVTLENADTVITLRSAGAKKWIVYQKHDK